MTENPETDPAKPHSWFRIWGELAGFWAISLAYPTYTQIASGSEALTSYGVRRPDLLVLILLVSVLGPLIISLAELLIRRLLGDRPRQIVHALALGALISLVFWQWLIDHEFGGLHGNGLTLILALLVAWLYVKAELMRNFAQILSLAAIVVVVVFIFDYPIKNEAISREGKAPTEAIESETPVVVVIFDELPLAALERPDGSIDPRFGNFASLARKSNWYPGALSLADQTTRAVPSILTGQDPYAGKGWEPPPPGLASYPNSICRIAEDGGYEVHSYEPVTDLCEQDWGLGTRVTATIRRALETESTGNDPLTPLGLAGKAASLLNSPFDVPWTEYTEDRPRAFDDFIRGLPEGDRAISVLHIALPHLVWMFSPDGSYYETLRPPGADMLRSPDTRGELARDAQQMMLQLAYTDRWLGDLIEEMKRNGIWDQSLFAVTADHGAAFLLDGSRRLVNLENVGWIAPVPLFIKFPGQAEGRVVPGTADGRDIAATVFARLGIEPPEEVTGRDLSAKRKLPRLKEHEMSVPLGGSLPVNVPFAEASRQVAVRYMHRLFGESLFAPGGHPELLGRAPGRMTEIPAEPTDPSLYSTVTPSSGMIPAYYEARLDPRGERPTAPVAVSLNGRIAATATPWQSDGNWFVGVNLPAGAFREGENAIRVYEIGSRQ